MADDFSLFSDLGVPSTKMPSRTVDGDSIFSHLGIDRPKGGAVIRDVPGDATPGPHGLMWNKDGGYDPKTGELVMGGQPLDKSSQGFLGGARAFVDGIVNGVPVAGPVLKGVVDRAAAIGAVGSDTKAYPAALEKIQQQSADAGAVHNYASGAGNVTGAVGSYVAAGLPATGAKILGYAGEMIPRMLWGAGSNTLIGATDAAVRGHDPLVGGAIGMVGGATAPVIGGIAGGGINKLTDLRDKFMPTGIEGVSRPAADLVNRAIAYEGTGAVQNALTQNGEHGILADAGPSLTGLTRALRDEVGPSQGVVENALVNRANGASDRVGSQLDQSLGPAKDPVIAARQIAEQRAVVNKAYEGIHANAPPVDVGGVVGNIDKALETATGAQKTALQRIRSELVSAPAKLDEAGVVIAPEKYVDNSQILHNLRQDIDAVINHGAPGLGVEQGAVSRTQGALKNVRGALDDTLKTQVPGMAETDAKSAMLARAQNAVDRGYGEILGGNGPHPETFAADRAARGASENVAENIGIRGRIDRMFGTGTQRDPAILNKLLAGGEADKYAVQNLETAFGKEPVNKLVNTLKQEQTFGRTYNEVLGNSATSRAKAAAEWLKEGTPGTTSVLNASPTGLVAQAGKSLIADPLISMILRTSSEPMRAEMAHILTAAAQPNRALGGLTRDEVVAKLLDLHARQGRNTAFGAAASNAANVGSNRLLMGVSGTQRPH